MSNTTRSQDAAARAQALDPARSFLVQAPAGSGKTELLIQRYLVLLARVDEPEAVVAITFTHKAAGEMRRRVLDALAEAAGPEPAEAHKAQTWRLARGVRDRDRERGWRLAENPNRLGIRTIDSLSASITRRMPWLSRLGSQPQLVEDARDLYREAARATIALVEDENYGPDMARVLLHLDNDCAALEELLSAMLARRDQWLRHLAGADPAAARPVLEGSLRNIIEEALDAARRAVPEAANELPALARHAAANVEDTHPVAACAGMAAWPPAGAAALPQWLGIAALLLTDKGTWRKNPDRRVGIPPESRREKQALKTLLGACEGDEAFRVYLDELRRLPPPVFDPGQWEVLEALVPVLLAAAAQLRLVFREHGQADFAEVSLAALNALGTDTEPTDLALALDARIQHLLVDEFQDTSITQFELLAKLTAGWMPGDGRTLFAVGDPMQSIYRFREAEVGLFLKAAAEGIGALRLVPLRLSANFRSRPGVVEWVNAAFPGVLGERDDIATGAVRFAPSVAVKERAEGKAVEVHAFVDEGDEAEAARVVEIVRETRARDGKAKIAVLVRARTHLPSILRALRLAGLPYRAVEIDQLGDVAVTQDLLALTRALLHPADRVAWLAVLRAPWCGLTLADLHALAAGDRRAAVWDLMRDPQRLARVSADGRRRLARATAALSAALVRRGERLRPRVEGCWLALGGPACATRPGEFENALAFLDLLETLDEGGQADAAQLAAKVDMLFAAADPEAGDTLEVMSIHKAKGLEFDVVILPGLGRKVQSDSPRLLAWLERPSERGGTADLLLAPVKPAGVAHDALYDYVKRIEKEKSRHETARLLYVAATRARTRLHLLGRAAVKDDHGTQVVSAPANSLLACLWPVVAADFRPAAANRPASAPLVEAAVIPPAPLRRLEADWILPAPPPSVAVARAELEPASQPDVSYRWAGDTRRHIGTVVHRMLQQVALEGVANWNAARIEERRPAVETVLRTMGVPPAELLDAVAAVLRAVTATLADERGRWILDSTHRDARSEFALSGVDGDRVIAARVDRTFVDADGVRWIIDFKTSEHEGGDPAAFLDTERERYRAQMTAYARLFARFDPRPVCMGLYFPLLGGWREYNAVRTA
ncbi:MAG TPA: UvrD-helicase domain-containing protein [Bryobacteraceae bacterium]|nr:UvrD-helicase domain-containing protein [Bryobacteraceae bacterium]